MKSIATKITDHGNQAHASNNSDVLGCRIAGLVVWIKLQGLVAAVSKFRKCVMNNNSAALSSKQKLYLALAVVFHFALLMWTVLPLIPLCCSVKVSKAAFSAFVFLGWFAAFPLSFFNAIGKRLSIASSVLVALIVVIEFGFVEGTYGLMAIEPLLGLTLGLFVALAL